MSDDAKTLLYWASLFEFATDADDKAECRCYARAWAAAIIAGQQRNI